MPSMIRYVSTRGGGAPASFTDVLLAGLAPDGGLYVPDSWPELDTPKLRSFAGLSYADLALNVMAPFIGDDIPRAALEKIVGQTYAVPVFDHAAIAPLAQIGPQAFLLELFHGPTFSFKDYALQLLGRLFDNVLAQRGQRLTIIGATSGDTGSAAIAACKDCEHIDIFILHPKGRTSEIQRRQMTTVDAPNVRNIAVDGTFDDCQALVKACFADEALRAELNLSAVNSINWARIMAQIVYYVAAAVSLGAPHRAVSFCVPTGNFGNVYAAHAARRMGLPVHSLTVATNANDILTRFFESGEMKTAKVEPSISPSMDIQVSSNFERYLYELYGRDGEGVADSMKLFAASKVFRVEPGLRQRAQRNFRACRTDDAATMAMMRECHEATGTLIDPHTAVGLAAAAAAMAADPHVPMVSLACAHPAKFPDSVYTATGHKPPLPEALAAVLGRAEHLSGIPNDLEKLKILLRQGTGR